MKTPSGLNISADHSDVEFCARLALLLPTAGATKRVKGTLAVLGALGVFLFLNLTLRLPGSSKARAAAALGVRLLHKRYHEETLPIIGTACVPARTASRSGFLATGVHTDGKYALFEAVVGPGGGPQSNLTGGIKRLKIERCLAR
jgi:hypothetical protein